MRWHLWLVGLVCLGSSSGCKREDVEILTRIGWKVTQKVQALVPDQTPFGGSWNPLAGGLEGRIRHRVANDKFLAATPLQFQVEGGTVRVRGSVGDELLRRRAIELIESTSGVESVIDEITPGT